MPADNSAAGPLDDDDYPAYTMGRAADLLGITPAFLRAVGEAGLVTPLRSDGGHRRYSRHQLRRAARARELVDQGTPMEAACRIIVLEDQLEAARRVNEELRRERDGSGTGDDADDDTGGGTHDGAGGGTHDGS
ncbi:MerR family transcriptional regulator [Streptomyces bullii]|uniref:MerR family transcriptional regulator n=1 Tax=Streptomyces bullii TaxID=349910 RepID=A0ABW0ULT8_9ACTN